MTEIIEGEIVERRPKIKYSYYSAQLSANYTRPHILCIAREFNGNEIKFGWSLCVPSRWEKKLGKEITQDENYKTAKREKEQLVEAVAFFRQQNGGATSEEIRAFVEEYHRENNIPKHYPFRNNVVKFTLQRGDVFSKKVARAIANERLKNSPISLINIDDDTWYASDAIIHHLATTKRDDIPQNVRHIAQYQWAKIRNYYDVHLTEEETNKISDAVNVAINSDENNRTHESSESPKDYSFLNNLQELWKSDLGKTTIIVGGICISYVLSLIFTSVVR